MSQAGRYLIGSGVNPPVETLTGNTGGPVGPDGAFNINVVGDGTTATVAGNPGTNTLTISTLGEVRSLSGNDLAVVGPDGAGNIQIIGVGAVNVSGTPPGNFLDISLTGVIPDSFPTDSGTAIPAAGILNIFSGATSVYNNMNTSGSGNTVSIKLNDYIQFPSTNAALTTGNIQINGDRFLHAYGTNNTFLGSLAGNTSLTVVSSIKNVGIGTNVLTSITSAARNVAIGYNALAAVKSTADSVAIGDSVLSVAVGGTNNIGIGSGALLSLINTNQHLAIGVSAGRNLTTGNADLLIGYNAASNLVTGSNNTIIGNNSGSSYLGAESSNVLLNNVGVLAENNTIRIGTTGGGLGVQNRCFIAGVDGVNVGSVAKVLTMASEQLGTATITAGTGIIVTPGANTITLSAMGGGLTWTDVTGPSVSLAINNGYTLNRATAVTATLPATAAYGSVIEIVAINTGLGSIAQNASQQIIFSTVTKTTVGATGSLTFTTQYGSIKLLCTTADTTFTVLRSSGSFTIV